MPPHAWPPAALEAAGRASARLRRLRARPMTGDNDTRTWMTLSYKQQRFIDEYMIDFNGTQAAIRAGYSPRTAGSQAYQLVTDDRIQGELRARAARVSRRASVDVAEGVERRA